MIPSETLGADPFAEPAPHFTAPLLGPLADLESFAGILRNYAEGALEMHLKHGFAFRSRLPRLTLSLVHPRHVHRVLRSHVRNYPKGDDYDFLRPILGNGIFVSDGDFWARQRRLLSTEFRPAAVTRFHAIFVDTVDAILAEWQAAGPGATRTISDDMMRLTIWGVGGALFKNDFRAQSETIGACLETCLEQGTLMMMTMGLLRPWMPTPGNLRARAAARRLDAIVRDAITQRRQQASDGDIISRLLQARDEETGGQMTDEQVLDEVKSLVLAGHETTSLTLSWALYLLARHPEALGRLVAEVDAVLGDRPPAPDDIGRLSYTRQVFLETMRLYPPVPAVVRSVREPDELDGIPVAPGIRIAIPIYATHRHPAFWPEPDRFDPERFAESRLGSIVPCSYLPFLIGRRVCLGEHFAMLEGVIALAMIVQRFRLEPVDDRPIGTRPISTLRLARPLRMRLHPRRP